jgi:hypothetical protein
MQDSVALHLLEGACPLLWEHHAMMRSPEIYVSQKPRHIVYRLLIRLGTIRTGWIAILLYMICTPEPIPTNTGSWINRSMQSFLGYRTLSSTNRKRL